MQFLPHECLSSTKQTQSFRKCRKHRRNALEPAPGKLADAQKPGDALPATAWSRPCLGRTSRANYVPLIHKEEQTPDAPEGKQGWPEEEPRLAGPRKEPGLQQSLDTGVAEALGGPPVWLV